MKLRYYLIRLFHYLSIATLIIAMLFGIQHWPYQEALLNITALLCLCAFSIIIYSLYKSSYTKQYKLRLISIMTLSFIIILLALGPLLQVINNFICIKVLKRIPPS